MHICIHLIHHMSIWCRRTSHLFSSDSPVNTVGVKNTIILRSATLIPCQTRTSEMVQTRQNQFSPISCLCIPVHPKRLLLVWLQKKVGVIVLLCMCCSNWPTWISLPHSLQTAVPEGDWCVLYTTHSQIITLVSVTSLWSWCWLHATSTDVASSL